MVALADIREGWTPERTGEQSLSAAVALIRAVGVIEPVLLRLHPHGGYEPIAAHRTVAAAREAGLDRIPAVVRDIDAGQALVTLALDGTATGVLTAAGAAALRQRMAEAGMGATDIEEVLSGQPVAEPEPVLAAPEPQPVAEPEPEPVAAAAAPAPSRGTRIDSAARWVPLPAGAPRLASLSSAFVDAPRLLRRLASEQFTGTFEIAGEDGREDVLTLLHGSVIAVTVERDGSRVQLPPRLNPPEHGPPCVMTVRPHPVPVAAALALGLAAPPVLTGLHAAFLELDGLLATLERRHADAACVISAPGGAGVILLDDGQPVAAYARRRGQLPGEEAEATDIAAVAELLAGGEGEVDVHSGRVPPPIDLEELIASA